MDDDDSYSYDAPRRPSPAKMSKVPSWISVGVVIGVLIGYSFHPKPPPAPPQVKVVEVPKVAPQPNPIPTVEAIFEAWRVNAVWRDDDTTQIAVWNPQTKEFSDFYEVLRVDDRVYFRSIPALTRELITYEGGAPDAPIWFAGAKEHKGRVEIPRTKAPPRFTPTPSITPAIRSDR